jgi:acyl carrier protein
MAEVSIDHLKAMLVENCMVKVDPDTIGDQTPLFGPESIGLDSLDALQMTIAVEKEYGLAIGDPATARDALQSLGVLRDWIASRLPPSPAP